MVTIRLPAIILAALVVVGSSGRSADAAPSLPCAGDAIVRAADAVASSEAAFRAAWRDSSPNWYTGFEARAPKRNPFDTVAAQLPSVDPVKGVAWAQGVYCLANLSPAGDEVLVRYYARVAAFHEGESWSRPFEHGLLQAYLVRRQGAEWRAAAVAGDETILLPGAIRNLPDVVPPFDPANPVPCRTGEVWSGKGCTPVRRVARANPPLQRLTEPAKR